MAEVKSTCGSYRGPKLIPSIHVWYPTLPVTPDPRESMLPLASAGV